MTRFIDMILDIPNPANASLMVAGLHWRATILKRYRFPRARHCASRQTPRPARRSAILRRSKAVVLHLRRTT